MAPRQERPGMGELFRGRRSLTYRRERAAFWLTLLFALPAAGVIGFFIHEEIGVSQVALFFVIAMVYVTLARGRLIGGSVRIDQSQYPTVFAIVASCAAKLNLGMPLVFVREDPLVPVVALGLGDPYSLVISSHWIDHFDDDELTFMIGRELAHIAAGHTRFSSLLSVNGTENVLVSLIFGSWLRKTELTADRVGLLCCGSLDAAMRAIVMATFHHFGRKVNHKLFALQSKDVQTDSVLRLGEWLGSVPYATTRIDAMQTFMQTQTYAAFAQEFSQPAAAAPASLQSEASAHVTKRDCAGWWRRFAAFMLDLIVVTTLLQTFGGGATARNIQFQVNRNNISLATPNHRQIVLASPEIVKLGALDVREAGILLGGTGLTWRNVLSQSVGALREPFWITLYLALLVALAGQTPGMMIAGLRVVRTDFRNPGIWQSVWRYVSALLLWWLIIPLSFVSRIHLHDALSKTRLIKTERVLARVSA